MKKIIVKCSLFACLTLPMLSCDSNKTAETSTGDDSVVNSDTGMDSKMDHSMNKMNADTNMNNPAKMSGNDDNDFMMKAAAGGMSEVEMGKLAQKNAASKEVKDFGKMMETDHTKANAELKKIAAGKNVSLPTGLPPENAMHMTDMQAKKGADFDKAYLDMMVEDHDKTIDLFKKASESADADIKNFATKTLPTLQMHKTRVKEIQDKMKM